jgi:hypothetical protein
MAHPLKAFVERFFKETLVVMARTKFAVNSDWWTELSDEDKHIFLKTIRKINLLDEEDRPVMSSELSKPNATTFKTYSSPRLEELRSKKSSCSDRCELMADAIAKWCEAEGGGAHSCMDEATDAYECCMEECENNKK